MMDIAVTTMAFAACAVSAGAGVMLGGFLASGKRADQDSEIALLNIDIQVLEHDLAEMTRRKDALAEQVRKHVVATVRHKQKLSEWGRKGAAVTNARRTTEAKAVAA